MSEAVASLRRDFPALGLTVGFSSPGQRAVIADGLLLWIEVRRACLTGENLVAAARLTWWRDALGGGENQGVPLAMRLVQYEGCAMLAEGLDAKMTALLYGDGADARAGADPMAGWCEVMGRWLAAHGGGGDPAANAAILKALDRAISGQAGSGQASTSMATGQPSLDLISWCCEKPSRLNYPHQHPLLALQMLGQIVLAAIKPPRKPSSH